MADNSLQQGTDNIATDDVATLNGSGSAGVKVPRTKVMYGDDGDARDVSTTFPLPVIDTALQAAFKQKNTTANITDFGQVILAQRRDSDTAETTADGQYTGLKMDQAGRLKVAIQAGDIVATAGNITAVSNTVFVNTNRLGALSITLIGTSIVGHNSIFEVSNDSTNGTDGNWKTVQVVRTDSNVIETTTGILAATPSYGWELNVANYTFFRVRATAHTSGTASYVLKPSAVATEPVPSSQNPTLVASNYSVAGVIAINTTLLTIDCANYKSLSIQCTSMGTTGVVTPQWSNDGATWITATLLSESGASSTTFNAAVLRATNVIARYFRLQLTTATTAGTTTIVVQASQAALPPIVTTQPVNGTVGVTGYPAAAASADALANPTITQIGADSMIYNGATWDRARNNANITGGDTGAKIVTFNGATQTNFNAAGAYITAAIGAVSGTTPTMTMQLQWSYDGGTNWINLGAASTAVTTGTQNVTFIVYPNNTSTAGATPANLTTGAAQTIAINAPLPRTWRIVYTIGGTTPSFTLTNMYVNYIN
jgi:hypothetical protein